MKFGAFFLLHSPQVRSTGEVYRTALDQMAYADALGFDSVWIAEHHFSNYGYCPNPLMLGVKAAQVTKQVRIGTAVLVLPFWNPLRLAEDIAMADVLTEGRLDVGVARGYQRYEFDRLGLDIEENRSLSDETLEVLLKALSGRPFEHEGEHHQIPETLTYPRSVQQPHPPVWLAASTPESFQSAVKLGLNCFTSGSTRPLATVRTSWKAFTDAGGDSSKHEFAVQQHIHCTPTDAEARTRMQNSLWHYRQSSRLRAGKERVEQGVAYADPVEGEPTDEQLWETHTLSGSPARVRAGIEAYREAVGLTQLNCIFALGSLGNETVKASIRLFAEQVMGHFK